METHVSIGRGHKIEDTELTRASLDEWHILLNEPSEFEKTTTGQMLRQIHHATNGGMRYVIEAQKAFKSKLASWYVA